MNRIPPETLEKIIQLALENDRHELSPKQATVLRQVNKAWKRITVNRFFLSNKPLLKLSPRLLGALVKTWKKPEDIPPFSLELDMAVHDRQIMPLLILGAQSLFELKLVLIGLSKKFQADPTRLQLPESFPNLRNMSIKLVPGSVRNNNAQKRITQRILDVCPNLQKITLSGSPPYPLVIGFPFRCPQTLIHLEVAHLFLPSIQGTGPFPVPLKLLAVDTRTIEVLEERVHYDSAHQCLIKLVRDCSKTLEGLELMNYWENSWIEEEEFGSSFEVNISLLPVMPKLKKISMGYDFELTPNPAARPGVTETGFPALEELVVEQRNVQNALSGWVDRLHCKCPKVYYLRWIISRQAVQNAENLHAHFTRDLIERTMNVFPALTKLSIRVPSVIKFLMAHVFRLMTSLEFLELEVWRNREAAAQEDTSDWTAVLLGVNGIQKLRRLGMNRGKWNQFLENADRQQKENNWEDYPASIRNLKKLKYFSLESGPIREEDKEDDEDMESYLLPGLVLDFGLGKIESLEKMKIGPGFVTEQRAVDQWRRRGKLIIVDTEQM